MQNMKNFLKNRKSLNCLVNRGGRVEQAIRLPDVDGGDIDPTDEEPPASTNSSSISDDGLLLSGLSAPLRLV
jgi:hypothetical protein